MKKRATVLLLGLALAGAAVAKDQSISGTAKKDVASVASSAQTGPNAAKLATDASKGKVNPNAGKEGTADPYKVPLLRDAKTLP